MLCSSGIGYPSAGELKGGGGGSMSKEDESEVSDSVLSARVLLNSLRGKSFIQRSVPAKVHSFQTPSVSQNARVEKKLSSK